MSEGTHSVQRYTEPVLPLLILTAAATTMVLPHGTDPADWRVPLAMAGLVTGGSTADPHVVLGADGTLCAVLPPDRQRCVSISLPTTDAEREEAVWLAKSLLRDVETAPQAAPPPAPTPSPAPPTPQPAPPPAPVAAAPPAEPQAELPDASNRAVLPIALSALLQWRPDGRPAPGGTLAILQPTDRRLQPLARIGGIGPERLSDDGPRRETVQLTGALGLRWQPSAGFTASLAGGLAWQGWRQDGDAIQRALLPQLTGQVGWQLYRSGPLAWQPWLGTTATLRSVSMTVDGAPLSTFSPFTGIFGLAIERVTYRP